MTMSIEVAWVVSISIMVAFLVLGKLYDHLVWKRQSLSASRALLRSLRKEEESVGYKDWLALQEWYNFEFDFSGSPLEKTESSMPVGECRKCGTMYYAGDMTEYCPKCGVEVYGNEVR